MMVFIRPIFQINDTLRWDDKLEDKFILVGEFISNNLYNVLVLVN